MGLAGLQGGYMNSSKSKDSIRIDLRLKNVAIDVDSGLLWLAFGRGVCVVGSGDFAAVSWFSFRSGVLQQST